MRIALMGVGLNYGPFRQGRGPSILKLSSSPSANWREESARPLAQRSESAG
jgi:hypothetical protein